MSFNDLYRDKRTQYKRASYQSIESINKLQDNGMLSPDGETYKFSKKIINFRCGIYEGEKQFGVSLTDGITVTNTTLILISTDINAIGIKRGDKVTFEGETYSVTDATIVRNPSRNTQFQRSTQNKVKVIALT